MASQRESAAIDTRNAAVMGVVAERDRLRKINAELLEALERALNEFIAIQMMAPMDDKPLYAEAIVKTRAAIAKARGE